MGEVVDGGPNGGRKLMVGKEQIGVTIVAMHLLLVANGMNT